MATREAHDGESGGVSIGDVGYMILIGGATLAIGFGWVFWG